MKVKGKKMRTIGNDEVVKRIIPGETDAKIDLKDVESVSELVVASVMGLDDSFPLLPEQP